MGQAGKKGDLCAPYRDSFLCGCSQNVWTEILATKAKPLFSVSSVCMSRQCDQVPPTDTCSETLDCNPHLILQGMLQQFNVPFCRRNAYNYIQAALMSN